MAYIKNIVHQCHASGCLRCATKELFNIRNSSHGYFCAMHAKTRLFSLLGDEQRQRNERSDELESLIRKVE